jgi:hypothetical protein
VPQPRGYAACPDGTTDGVCSAIVLSAIHYPHPYLAKVWRRKGQALQMPAAGEDHKAVAVGAVGALDDASSQVLWQPCPRTGETAVLAFLEHLAAALAANEPIVLVLDHVGSHKRHALREVWRRYATRLEPCFLPAYAPQLTLIERLWRYLKQKLACHRWWNDLDRLIQATETLLANLAVHLHALDGPSFRPAHNSCQSA